MDKSRIDFKNYEIVDSGAKFYKSKDGEEGFYHVCDEYRRTAFTNYLQHKNYISPIIKACYR